MGVGHEGRAYESNARVGGTGVSLTGRTGGNANQPWSAAVTALCSTRRRRIARRRVCLAAAPGAGAAQCGSVAGLPPFASYPATASAR